MGKTPIFIRTLTDEERTALTAGLRSRDAFVLRRCQILLASAAGKRASQIARDLGCDADTVLNAINAFNQDGLDALVAGSNAPHTPIGPSRPRLLSSYGPCSTRVHATCKTSSRWTLELAAEVSFEQGLMVERVSREAVRTALQRLGVSWKRAKQWISSPEPAYARKKPTATD